MNFDDNEFVVLRDITWPERKINESQQSAYLVVTIFDLDIVKFLLVFLFLLFLFFLLLGSLGAFGGRELVELIL